MGPNYIATISAGNFLFGSAIILVLANVDIKLYWSAFDRCEMRRKNVFCTKVRKISVFQQKIGFCPITADPM